MTLKPIETYYNGYRFRSRLEARWAVFFDEAKIRYQYEPEGFEVKIGESKVIRYLPDFYLPDLGVYAEVKPSAQKLLEDEAKLAWMVDYGGPMADGLLILGQIPYVGHRVIVNNCPQLIPLFPVLKNAKGIYVEWSTFVIPADRVHYHPPVRLIASDVISDVTSAPELPDVFPDDLNMVWASAPVVVDGIEYLISEMTIPYYAYDAARQARFEHGEVLRG